MKYQGGKSKIAKHIAKIINNFVGGGGGTLSLFSVEVV